MCDLQERHLVLACIIDALFCSELEASAAITAGQVARAVNDSLRAHRDWNGLTRAIRAAYANEPTEAACREEWCRRVAEDALNRDDIALNCDGFWP